MATVTCNGSSIALTGEEVVANYKDGNPLNIKWIFFESIDCVSRVSWDGKTIDVISVAVDSDPFVKSCIPSNVTVNKLVDKKDGPVSGFSLD